MSATVEAFASVWRPRDTRTRSEWVRAHVRPPGSARGTMLDVSLTPWLQEPLDFSSDNRVKEQVLLMPTGAGKTSVLDGIIPHAITEDPGGILLILQTDQDAKEYVEERLMPILAGVDPVRHLLEAMDRHAIRKDAVIFPHMPFYMSGAKLTALQRRSVRYCLGDEVWRWKHGFVKEFRARTHDRWNARVVLVSQGGDAHLLSETGLVETELEAAWARTDRREWCFQCPECNRVQRYRLTCLKYDSRAETPEGLPDETAIYQSAHYVCEGTLGEKPACSAVFADRIDVRRMLAATGRYVAQNPRHLARCHGWHCNALALPYLAHGELAVEHAQAMRFRRGGDETPLKIFRQKRMAENHRAEEKLQDTVFRKGDYDLAEYHEGGKVDGEVFRSGFADVQRDHFVFVARAWRADGSSRRVHCGKINTEEMLADAVTRLGIEGRYMAVDSGHFTDRVYNLCAKYGWRAFKGDHADSYKHVRKHKKPLLRFFSPPQPACGSAGRPCQLTLFSNLQVKRILERLRNGPQLLPDGTYTEVPEWEVERDISPKSIESLYSEREKIVRSPMGKTSCAFVPIGKRPNHEWDGEVGNLVFALWVGVLGYQPANQPEEKPAATAE